MELLHFIPSYLSKFYFPGKHIYFIQLKWPEIGIRLIAKQAEVLGLLDLELAVRNKKPNCMRIHCRTSFAISQLFYYNNTLPSIFAKDIPKRCKSWKVST